MLSLYVDGCVCAYSEQEILREEIQSLQAVKTRLKSRVSELEDELKKSKEDLEKAKTSRGTGEDGEEVTKLYIHYTP